MKPWFCLFLLGVTSLSSFLTLIFCILFWAMGKEANYFLPSRPFYPTTILNSALFLFITITFYVKFDLGMFVFAFPNQNKIPLYLELLNMTYRVFHCASLCLGTLWLLDIWCCHNEIELLFNAYNKIKFSPQTIIQQRLATTAIKFLNLQTESNKWNRTGKAGNSLLQLFF